ncbi:SLOG family protein [Streptomyces osmaniensis]|uniref:YspA cpYpsA-related SLOG domain-containing protein n=1 Tax=Streptomyces osmaniensis TaxID=593134 RepID=A0ABP6YUJ6_9ACTN
MSEELALIGLTGSRAWPDIPLLETTLYLVWHDALQVGYDGMELMHGCADGADTYGDRWAKRNGIFVRERAADWEGPCAPDCKPGHRRTRRDDTTFCPQAGHRRNQDMVDEHPLLFVAAPTQCTLPKCRTARPHDSHGTADCIRRAEAAGIPVWCVRD